MPRKCKVNIGDTNNRLEVIAITRKHDGRTNRPLLTCRCICGNIREDVRPTDFTNGGVKSCGCSRIKHGRSQTPEYWMFYNARERAQKSGVPFEITLDDIIIPKRCPLLDIPLFLGKKVSCDNSPTLDRLIPIKGYIPGNVLVISNKANRIKSNATIDEIMLLADNLHHIIVN